MDMDLWIYIHKLMDQIYLYKLLYSDSKLDLDFLLPRESFLNHHSLFEGSFSCVVHVTGAPSLKDYKSFIPDTLSAVSHVLSHTTLYTLYDPKSIFVTV